MSYSIKTKGNLQEIELKSISLTTTNPRKTFDIGAFNDLVKSIEEHGVIQPILVRPIKTGFELVCGERRFKACQKLKTPSIPCHIKELTDQEAFELQIIENLERENVHPMQEATAFKKLLTFKNYTTVTISQKIAKSQSYVLQRLELNKLIPQWKEHFYNEQDITISHALEISRLTHKHQEELLETAREWDKSFKSLKSLKSLIKNNIINSLNDVPFSLTEKTLLKEVGSCQNCEKRSGKNALLFSDIEDNNTCFDSHCFSLKKQVHALNQITDIITNEKSVKLIYDPYSNNVSQKIEKLITDYKVDTLKKYDDFYIKDEESKNTIKGIWINGSDIGRIVNVEISKKDIQKKKAADCTNEELIEKIKIREVRSKELDQEKIHKNIVASFESIKDFDIIGKVKQKNIDIFLERYMVLCSADYHLKERLFKKLKLTSFRSTNKKVENKINQVLKLTKEQMTYAVRQIALENYKSHLPSHDTGNFLRLLAEEFKEIPIKKIEDEQKQIAKKRQSRQKERINKLKSNKKES